jgi:hypothetical protein
MSIPPKYVSNPFNSSKTNFDSLFQQIHLTPLSKLKLIGMKKERERERAREKDKERERKREGEKDKERGREREKERERGREREAERE